jgi:hypothetical protein
MGKRNAPPLLDHLTLSSRFGKGVALPVHGKNASTDGPAAPVPQKQPKVTPQVAGRQPDTPPTPSSKTSERRAKLAERAKTASSENVAAKDTTPTPLARHGSFFGTVSGDGVCTVSGDARKKQKKFSLSGMLSHENTMGVKDYLANLSAQVHGGVTSGLDHMFDEDAQVAARLRPPSLHLSPSAARAHASSSLVPSKSPLACGLLRRLPLLRQPAAHYPHTDDPPLRRTSHHRRRRCSRWTRRTGSGTRPCARSSSTAASWCSSRCRRPKGCCECHHPTQTPVCANTATDDRQQCVPECPQCRQCRQRASSSDRLAFLQPHRLTAL